DGKPPGLSDSDAGAVEVVHSIERFAVNVQLELVGGSVSNPHRVGAAIALPIRQDFLVEVGAAVNAVHDIQRVGALLPGLRNTVAEPLAEGDSLIDESHAQQCMNRE